jgi:peptidoglycan/xylan/chitin deacetylase (PgdA/CDA1 family)
MANTHWKPTLLILATLLLHVLALVVLIAEPAQWRWALGAVLANHLLLMFAGLWPRCHWLGPNWTRLPAAAANRHEIALTIDDGPDPVVTPQLLDLLDRYDVRATFFCIGEKAARYPELCRDIVRRGHTIENHSQHHRHYFAMMNRSGFLRELEAAQATLTAITGRPPLFFRAPAGLRNPFLDPVLTKLDLRLASWSARGFDTQVNDAARVSRRLLHDLRPGAILLLHDGNAARTSAGTPVILDVLPTVLTAAKTAGLRFVTLTAALS